MIDLNDKKAIASIDKSNAYSSVSSIAMQCEQAWEDTRKIDFPQEYGEVQNIVLCGMGASAYAALIIKSLYSKHLFVPLELVNGYDLPNYVGENTLVLLSSYSGGTEEVITCAKEALRRKAKITAVCNGSDLAEFVKKNSIPAYIFDAKFNPAQQPRLGQGYMIFGHVGILSKIGLLPNRESQLKEAIEFITQKNDEIESFAKNMVPKLMEKIPVFVASEHLAANSHVIRNQMNETSKNFATQSNIPELNHFLMEGLTYPKTRILTFILFRSLLYSPIIQKRFELTKDVIEKNNVETINIDVKGENDLEQMLYALAFGGYLTFYLGIAYGQDPSLIPWVDYFKEKLKTTT